MFVDADEIDAVGGGVAPIVNGDKTPVAIQNGEYILLRNHSTLADGGYYALTNIAANGNITSSNVGLTSAGIANTILRWRLTSTSSDFNVCQAADTFNEYMFQVYYGGYVGLLYLPIGVIAESERVMGFAVGMGHGFGEIKYNKANGLVNVKVNQLYWQGTPVATGISNSLIVR